MPTKAKGKAIQVTFVYNKETENCIRMGAASKDEAVFGALYIRKDDFPEGCTEAIITVEFKEN
tara:strand:- start:232 stop:420 length:189 start_codon:yes stop_codon:yes gene_type:complete